MIMPNYKLLGICVVLSIVLLFYYALVTKDIIKSDFSNGFRKTLRIHNTSARSDYDVWIIFSRVGSTSPLRYKFQNLLKNLLHVTSVPLRFNIIVDKDSKNIAEETRKSFSGAKVLEFQYYDIESVVNNITDIVEVMTPHFSSKPGSYYSGALFYISLGLFRIAPKSQKRAILLDCDLYFKRDIALLFNEFDNFKPTALFGLAPELSPVYYHILYLYKLKHKTTFGDYYSELSLNKSAVHPHGYQGYNSGVVLMNLEALRESDEFPQVISKENVEQMVKKYRFRGHLGDQDFYTLLGYEYPHLIQTINCGFNRQLCTWWSEHGYPKLFYSYSKCNHSIVVLHGNCKTKLPEE